MTRQIESPDLKEVLDDNKLSIFSEFNCHTIGRIESFDTSTQTASIRIVYKRIINEIAYDYPLLVDCPVVVLTGGDSSIRFPITEGDTCIIFFNDRDIDIWLDSGQITTLNSERTHSLSDGMALVGIRNSQNEISNYVSDRLEIVKNTTLISLKDKIKIENDIQNLKTLVDSLIDAIKGITTTAPATISVASQAILDGVKSDFGDLLE